MSVLLWTGEGDDDAVSLGSLLEVFPAFADLAGVLGDDPAFAELQSVPGLAEQQVTPWWLGEAARQAEAALKAHGGKLPGRVHRVLHRLIAGARGATAPA